MAFRFTTQTLAMAYEELASNKEGFRVAMGNFMNAAPQAFRQRNVFCSDRVFSTTHPSSREPGNFADVQSRRMEILSALSQTEREAYLTEHKAKMSGKPRIQMVV